MDKAIIVGVYEFIGYQLCQSLLQEGVEVYGVHIPTDTSEAIIDEKRLLIGRNSNFYEMDETFLANLDDLEKSSFLFFDYYSFYMNRKEEIFMRKIQSCLQKTFDSAVILPIQKLRIDNDHDPNLDLFQCKHRFFLPSIYGPWQPSNYFFSKAILHPNGKHQPEKREWTDDTLFVEDAIETILKRIEAKNENSVLLKSNIENHWQKIVIELRQQMPSNDKPNNVEFSDDIEIHEVKGIPYKEGLQRQKNIIIRMQNSL